MPHSQTIWDIHLSHWIIQDGNYPDFAVGRSVEFALEFWLPEGVAAQPSGEPIHANPFGDCLYDTVAEVVLQTEEITVLDIGVQVYCESLSPPLLNAPRRARVAVQLGLGVDPFFYFERLYGLDGVPPLIYSRNIISIQRQTAPFVEETPIVGPYAGQKVRTRDRTQLSYEQILATDAWSDDGGSAEYMLRCELLPIPPKRVSATAIPMG